MDSMTYLTIKDINKENLATFKEQYNNPKQTILILDSEGGDLSLVFEWANLIKSPVVVNSATSAAAHLCFLIPKPYRYYTPLSYVIFKPIQIKDYSNKILVDKYQQIINKLETTISNDHPLRKIKTPIWSSYLCLKNSELEQYGFKQSFNIPIAI